ncbi:MAG TPA: alpha/beta fold hydrolase [Fimbriimonadaceae bacterium]|jgi:dienelactone hydrolase
MLLPLVLFITAQTARPLPTPNWATLAGDYKYTRLSAKDISNETKSEENGHIKISFAFKGTPGDTVHGVLLEPKGVASVPVVLLLHGLGGSKDEMLKDIGPSLLAQGIGCAAIDAPGHGERQTSDDQKVMQSIGSALVYSKGDLLKSIVTRDTNNKALAFLQKATIDGVLDNRHLIDFVTSRKEVDTKHISVFGVSMGSMMGAVLGPVDPRVKCMALLVGGDPVIGLIPSLPAQYQQIAFAGACSLYAPHFAGPVHMINASKDSIMPAEASERLFEAFPAKTKTINYYNSDHYLPGPAYVEGEQFVVTNSK